MYFNYLWINGSLINFPLKNRMAWTDVTIIRSHLIIRGFVEDYTVWIHHGETVVVYDDDDLILETLSQYSAELDA